MICRRPRPSGGKRRAHLRHGTLLAPGAFALCLALFAGPSAHAVDYPWCYVDQTMSGATYCAFETLTQCQQNAGGNGGFCVQNPSWRRSPAPDARRSQRR